jgi:hypothetical protein
MAYFPLEISVYPHMRDHAFNGRVMFSAAELLSMMAAHVQSQFPDPANIEQADARFPRFLMLPPEEDRALSVLLELETHADGGLTARLLHKFQSRSGTISRLREHVRVRFQNEDNADLFPPVFNEASVLSGDVFEIPAERIYEELIPFGPAYRNIRGQLRMNAQGAVALLSTARNAISAAYPVVPLISDAAFQAACVWGQRYSGKVVFPVGFRRRCFWKALQPEGSYLCRVFPVDTSRESLVFDLWIHEREGTLCEAILGLRMMDVTSGRIKPPRWVQDRAS